MEEIEREVDEMKEYMENSNKKMMEEMNKRFKELKTLLTNG